MTEVYGLAGTPLGGVNTERVEYSGPDSDADKASGESADSDELH